MICTTIISWILNVIEILLSLLPNVDPTTITAISSYTTSFRSALTSINWFFPVNTALFFLTLIFGIQIALFLFKIIRYIAGVLTVGILK
jgi:hypothetical protein